MFTLLSRPHWGLYRDPGSCQYHDMICHSREKEEKAMLFSQRTRQQLFIHSFIHMTNLRGQGRCKATQDILDLGPGMNLGFPTSDIPHSVLPGFWHSDFVSTIGWSTPLT